MPQGTPREVITPELVRTLYHLDAESLTVGEISASIIYKVSRAI